jgi:hypothetical protein
MIGLALAGKWPSLSVPASTRPQCPFVTVVGNDGTSRRREVR